MKTGLPPFCRTPASLVVAALVAATRWRFPGRVVLCGRQAVLTLALIQSLTVAAAPSPTEYQVKAVFLFNFTQFTEWPASAFSATNAPIVIGIVGEDPFGKTMDDLVRGEVVRGHPLVVKRLGVGDDLTACHVLFISRSEKERQATLAAGLRGRPVLTVGETDRFLEQGGVVNLLIVKERVRFEINAAAAERAGLKISSKLQSLATRVVKTGGDR